MIVIQSKGEDCGNWASDVSVHYISSQGYPITPLMDRLLISLNMPLSPYITVPATIHTPVVLKDNCQIWRITFSG